MISDAEIVRTFHLKITLADKSTKALAWCTGQTAMDLLQISPEEFYDLPEVITYIRYQLFLGGKSCVFMHMMYAKRSLLHNYEQTLLWGRGR